MYEETKFVDYLKLFALIPRNQRNPNKELTWIDPYLIKVKTIIPAPQPPVNDVKPPPVDDPRIPGGDPPTSSISMLFADPPPPVPKDEKAKDLFKPGTDNNRISVMDSEFLVLQDHQIPKMVS